MAKPFDADHVWFTSDLHFGHTNVIRYMNRPYANTDEMDADYIKTWNATVTPQDFVFVLGDVSFQKDREVVRRTVSALNGQIHLIKGNHDHKKHIKVFLEHNLIQWVGSYKEIRVADPDGSEAGSQRICMSHFPFLVWHQNHRGAWMLHGHSHGSLDPDPTAKRLDVGWDVWKKPVSYFEIKEAMKPLGFTPRDGHGRPKVR